MESDQDFTIEEGVLLEYDGLDRDVVIPEGVKKIGEYAFLFPPRDFVDDDGFDEYEECHHCDCYCEPDWRGLELDPDCIECDSFVKNTYLTSITIPGSVRMIDRYAFYGCAGLKSVVIPEGVTEIGEYAFGDCTGLQSVVIPKSIKTIYEGAFWGCTSLTNVTLLNSEVSIDFETFKDAPWLKNMGDFAVVNQILLQYNGDGGDVVIPAGVRSIIYYAFSDNKGLQSVTIPESVTEIEDSVFRDCTGLKCVTIMGRGLKISRSTFEDSRPILVAPHIPIQNFVTEDKPGACAGFSKLYQEKAELDEEIRAGYLKYIKDRKKELYPLAVRHKELLRLMLAEKMLSRKDVDILLAECDNQNNAAAKAAVQDYINTL
jgi:hypothetical protein